MASAKRAAEQGARKRTLQAKAHAVRFARDRERIRNKREWIERAFETFEMALYDVEDHSPDCPFETVRGAQCGGDCWRAEARRLISWIESGAADASHHD